MSRDLRGAFSVTVLCAGIFFAGAAAADEPLTASQSDVYDSYTADPAESYVVEMQDGMPSEERQSAGRTPVCRAFFPAVAGHGAGFSSGTICEQSDGSLRMVTAPASDLRDDERASGYCREYQQMMDRGGDDSAAHGTVCWQTDGSWRVVRSASFEPRNVPREVFEPAYAARAPYTDEDAPEIYERAAPRIPPRISRPAIVEQYRTPEFYDPPRRFVTPRYAPTRRAEVYVPSFGERIHRLLGDRSRAPRPRFERRYSDRYDND
jgi:hypothetical protein